MITTIFVLNIFLALGLAIHAILHCVFDSDISSRNRIMLMVPVFTLVVYILSGINCLIDQYSQYALTQREVVWVIVQTMLVLSMGSVIMTVCGSKENAKGY